MVFSLKTHSFVPIRPRSLLSLHRSPRLNLYSSSLQSNSHRPQRHPWPEKLSRTNYVPLGISVILVVGLGWFYHHSPNRSEDTLKIDRFRPFKILNSKDLTHDTALLKLNVSLPNLNPVTSLFYIESIYLKHPALQIERPYTPLSSITPRGQPKGDTDAEESCQVVDLLVKRYSDGDMSTYLHHVKTPGNQVEIRGPVPTWHHPNDNQIDELIFIAAGTGITPAIQLLRRFFGHIRDSNQQGFPKFLLIYLARSLESAHFLEEIHNYHLNNPALMGLKLIVSREENGCAPLQKLIDKVGNLGYSDIQKWVGKNEQERKKMIIVCGPESLICAVAGCHGRTYTSQGELGGMLKSLGYSANQVVKL